MTRACSCGRYLGEKCSRCSSERLHVFKTTTGYLLFKCNECHQGFKGGEGGITTGLCKECEARLKEEIVGKDEIRA